MSANVKIALIIVFATIVWLGSGLMFEATQADTEQPKSALTKVTTAEFMAE